MFTRLQRSRKSVAFFAMVVLVLQGFFTSWAGGAMASPDVDAFGNPLCITGTNDGASAPLGDHAKLPNCCTLGCSFSSVALPAPADEVLANLLPQQSDRVHVNIRSLGNVGSLDHDPGSPRAPPLTA